MQLSRLPKNPCRYCGSMNHYPTFCPRKPNKPIKVNKPPNKIGRVGRETANAVARWKRTQTPTHEGYFICYMCGRWITYLTAEHVKSKARRPDLRTNPDNFKQTCDDCNDKKRSRNN